ncbi:ATP-grasp domain-containing protein [Variovorax paradoxus]
MELIVQQCKEIGADYVCLSDLRDIDSVYSLVSYLKSQPYVYQNIVSCDETTQLAVSVLMRELLNSNEEAQAIAAMKDKRLMKLSLGDDVRMARFVSLHDVLEKNDSNSEIVFPVVMKPVHGRGSMETYLVKDMTALREQAKSLSCALSEYILEEFIDGMEYNVDAIWQDGLLKNIYVGRYIVPRLRGYYEKIDKVTMYLPASEHQEIYAAMQEKCTTIVRKLGFKNGITHAEFFVNGDVITLGEIAARHAGGGMSAAVRVGAGEGLFELGIRSKIGCLATSPAKSRIDAGYVGFIDLKPNGSGTIRKLVSKEKLLEIDGIVEVDYRMALGDRIEDHERNSWGVMAIINAPSEAAFKDVLQEAKRKFVYELA